MNERRSFEIETRAPVDAVLHALDEIRRDGPRAVEIRKLLEIDSRMRFVPGGFRLVIPPPREYNTHRSRPASLVVEGRVTGSGATTSVSGTIRRAYTIYLAPVFLAAMALANGVGDGESTLPAAIWLGGAAALWTIVAVLQARSLPRYAGGQIDALLAALRAAIASAESASGAQPRPRDESARSSSGAQHDVNPPLARDQ